MFYRFSYIPICFEQFEIRGKLANEGAKSQTRRDMLLLQKGSNISFITSGAKLCFAVSFS